jgi:hypothetical protein
MLSLIFTLDYEIHGNGDGSPAQLMVEPTDRMLRLFDQYGAKLTIMADVGEILRFRAYRQEVGQDDFQYEAIVEQLRRAVRTGHDVQLHIHSSYFNAKCQNGRWDQDWSEYNFAGLSRPRMAQMVREGKVFLEGLLQPVEASYRCIAFRAANWSVSPSQAVADTLIENGISIDTSVFKYGRRDGMVTFDYSTAHHALLPWRADRANLCREDKASQIWEFPIYAEERPLSDFLTAQRVYRAVLGRRHRVQRLRGETPPAQKRQKESAWRSLFRRHAWKADFNQCSGRQLIGSLRRAEGLVPAGCTAPFVLIGHSKLFTRWNARSLKPLLKHVQEQPHRYSFGLFKDFDLERAGVPACGALVVRER